MGYKVREMRKKTGMTQEELSKCSGVSRAIISGLENNTARATSTDTLLRLAAALGVPVQEIFFETIV